MREALTKDQVLIEYLISDPDLYIKCQSILKYEYFPPELQNTVKFILEYSSKYNNIPSVDLIEAESNIILETRKISKDKFEYTCDAVEKYCRNAAFNNALTECIKLVDGNIDASMKLVQDALSISLDKDLGVDYFENPRERLENQLANRSFQSTGYPDLDDLLGGGLIKGQMVVFSGNSGVGKSMTLSNIGMNLMEQGLRVSYVSLELSEELVSNRFDALLNGHNQKDWDTNIDAIVDTIEYSAKNKTHGRLTVKYMFSNSNANQVRSYLKDFEIQKGYTPDVLILDYLDIAGANDGSMDANVSLKDKYVSEEFRNLANEWDMYFLTASQQNRAAIGNLEPDQSHIAGGLTKANTSDFWFSIIATPEMKNEGILMYHCLKARSSDGTGKSMTLRWTPGSARIVNINSSDSNLPKNIIDLKEKQSSKNIEHLTNSVDNRTSTLMNLIT